VEEGGEEGEGHGGIEVKVDVEMVDVRRGRDLGKKGIVISGEWKRRGEPGRLFGVVLWIAGERGNDRAEATI